MTEPEEVTPELTDEEIAAMRSEAARMGKRAGECAASWVFDGNTSDETYARVLEGIEDGDPAVLDMLRFPNLSGEFAGDPTPQSLADDLGLDMESEGADELLSELCDAWDDTASEAFIADVERTARRHVGK